MSFVIRSLPTKSSQLKNKNASALISFFASDTPVLYLYGNAGTGKTFAVNMLAKEYGYEVLYISPPFDENMVIMASSSSLFMNDKKLIVVDVGDTLKVSDLNILSKGRWNETRLIIIGDTYSKTSPMRNAFKDMPYKFEAIKFHQFEEMDILSCLTMYAAELGARVSYESLLQIAKESAGDMRAARLCLRALIASGNEENIKSFLPLSDAAYFSNISKLFSENIEDVQEAVEFFGDYMTIQLIRKNIVAKLPNRPDLMYMLKMSSALTVDYADYLVQLACMVGRLSKTKKFVSFKKAVPFEVPNIQTKCSNAKKILYLGWFEKWNEKIK
jgi:hypothetical protein